MAKTKKEGLVAILLLVSTQILEDGKLIYKNAGAIVEVDEKLAKKMIENGAAKDPNMANVAVKNADLTAELKSKDEYIAELEKQLEESNKTDLTA